MTVKAPPLSEKDFLRQVTDLATRRGWSWVHFLPAMHKDNWRTPFQGPLGKGWPDLVLVRESDARLIFAELKAEGKQISADQGNVIALLTGIAVATDNQVEVFVWHPRDWDDIEAILR